MKFSPEEYDIKLDSMDEATAIDKYNMASFNFKLAGFTLSSAVIFSGESVSSPIPNKQKEGINLGLYKQNTKIASAKTNEKGSFSFNDVKTGDYEVRVEADDLSKLKLKSNSMKCKYSWEDGASCNGEIVLIGTPMKIKVTIANEKIHKGLLLLKTTSPNDLSECQKATKAANVQIPKGFTCATPIKDGSAVFEDMPFGRYQVSVQFDSPNAFVEPSLHTIDHPKDTESSKIINFEGYSKGQKCQVLTPKGTGIEGVEIKIDGEKRFVTDKQGYFTLDKIKMGSYELEAIHPNFAFFPRHVVVDGSSELSLGKISADLISLCGKVEVASKGADSSSGVQASVQIENNETREKRNTKIQQDGTYCYELPPGVYTVKPSVTQQEKHLNVVPRQRTITLLDEPAYNVDFSREKLSIKGSVSYNIPIRQSIKEKTEIQLLNQQGHQVKVYKGSGENGFEFGDLFEDGYQLKIMNPRICFEKDLIHGDDALSSGATFIAKGMQVKYKSDVRFQALVNGKVSVEFTPKKRSICIPVSGQLTLTAKDHFTFKHGMNIAQVQTDSEDEPKELVYEVDKIKLMGKLRINNFGSNLEKDIMAKLNAQSIKLKVIHHDGKVTTVIPNRNHKGKLEYFIDVKLQDSLTIEPIIQIEDLKKRVVIEPPTGKFSISEFNGKFNSLTKFKFSIGKLVRGHFNKEVKGATVVVLRRKLKAIDSDFSVFKKKLISGNLFELGPYSSKFEYGIKVLKKGVEFKIENSKTKTTDTEFHIDVLEISELQVKVVTGPTSIPLEGVMVYVTSTDRNNYFKESLTTGKKGTIKRNIHMGQYFIKPVLKEYEFDPPQSLMKVEEGQKASLEIKAKRTQFSAKGSVKSFGTYYVDNLKVEATCEERDNMVVETSSTDKFGNFVVRGLIPGKTYNLKVSTRDHAIIIPDHLTFIMDSKDSVGVFSSNSAWLCSSKSVENQIYQRKCQSIRFQRRVEVVLTQPTQQHHSFESPIEGNSTITKE